MLCGGTESALIPIGLGGYIACGALSKRNSDPTRASRPWDRVLIVSVNWLCAIITCLEGLKHD